MFIEQLHDVNAKECIHCGLYGNVNTDGEVMCWDDELCRKLWKGTWNQKHQEKQIDCGCCVKGRDSAVLRRTAEGADDWRQYCCHSRELMMSVMRWWWQQRLILTSFYTVKMKDLWTQYLVFVKYCVVPLVPSNRGAYFFHFSHFL